MNGHFRPDKVCLSLQLCLAGAWEDNTCIAGAPQWTTHPVANSSVDTAVSEVSSTPLSLLKGRLGCAAVNVLLGKLAVVPVCLFISLETACFQMSSSNLIELGVSEQI